LMVFMDGLNYRQTRRSVFAPPRDSTNFHRLTNSIPRQPFAVFVNPGKVPATIPGVQRAQYDRSNTTHSGTVTPVPRRRILTRATRRQSRFRRSRAAGPRSHLLGGDRRMYRRLGKCLEQFRQRHSPTSGSYTNIRGGLGLTPDLIPQDQRQPENRSRSILQEGQRRTFNKLFRPTGRWGKPDMSAALRLRRLPQAKTSSFTRGHSANLPAKTSPTHCDGFWFRTTPRAIPDRKQSNPNPNGTRTPTRFERDDVPQAPSSTCRPGNPTSSKNESQILRGDTQRPRPIRRGANPPPLMVFQDGKTHGPS